MKKFRNVAYNLHCRLELQPPNNSLTGPLNWRAYSFNFASDTNGLENGEATWPHLA